MTKNVASPRFLAVAYALPLVLVGSWAASDPSAGADATRRLQEAERRLAQLEARLVAGPGEATRIRTPFEVVDARGAVILRVAGGGAGGGAVVISSESGGRGKVAVFRGDVEAVSMETAPQGHGGLVARDATGKLRTTVRGDGAVMLYDEQGAQVAGMHAAKGLGTIGVWRGDARIAALVETAGAGTLQLASAKGPTADLGPGSAGNTALRIYGPTGAPAAALGADPKRSHAGTLLLHDAAGGVAAAVLGGPRGTVLVADKTGATVAQMSVSDELRGVFQVFSSGVSVAALTKGVNGGLLQIASNAGVPSVEAGVMGNGRGTVRAGPQYKCSPIQPATPGMSFGLPDCIVGQN